MNTIKTSLILIIIALFVSCSQSENNSTDSTDDMGQSDDEPINTQVLDDSKNLGVNFNEQLQFIDNDQLIALKTEWVRGFLDFFRYYEDPSLLNTDEQVSRYLSLQTYNFKTVLNIKFLFRDKDYPPQGSEELQNQMNMLQTILDKTWGKTDIIIVGNEPFIETDAADYGESMLNYYKEAAQLVKAYGDEHGSKPIFIGAFDNTYQDRRQNLPIYNEFFDYAENTSWISGVDLHIHHSNPDEMNAALDYAANRIREDQKIIVSEFSLMKHFRSNLNAKIPATFAATYNFSENLRNYQYIDYALKNQVEKAQWEAFLSQSPWFENRKHYLSNSFYDIFSKHDKFFLANYAFRQSYPFNVDYTATTDPWILNGLYANRTVEEDPETGRYQFNYAWADDFIAIQNNSN